jgi:IclR helix-turn-helix domain
LQKILTIRLNLYDNRTTTYVNRTYLGYVLISTFLLKKRFLRNHRLDANTKSLDKRDWIAGLEKGLQLIEAFDDAHPRMTSSQAGERCGMTRTAARRYLLTLTHLGYVATDGKLFWLTPRMLRLGQSYLDSARLPRIVQPFLQRVAAGTSEVAYVCVLDGEEIVYMV